MKRTAILILLGAAVAAAGLWFGLPVYAEQQFRNALDSYAAGRGDDRVGHGGVRVDYWNDRAELGSFTDRVDIPAGGGRTLSLLVTLRDVAVEDYNLDALNRALAGAGGEGPALASRLSWSGLSVARAADGVTFLTGGAGALDGVRAMRLGAPLLLAASGLQLDGLAQKDLELVWDDGGIAAAARIDSVSLRGLSGSALSAAALGPVRADLTVQDPENEGPFVIGLASGRLEVEDVAVGDRIDFGRLIHGGLVADFDLPVTLPATTGIHDAPSGPLKGQMAWESWEIEGGRLDPASMRLYPAVLRALPPEGGDPTPGDFAPLVETAITLLERAERLDTGFDRSAVSGMLIDLGDLQKQMVETMEISGVHGLRMSNAAVRGQRQSDQFGNRSHIELYEVADVDLSALPAYLRRVLGAPVLPESLDRAGDFYRDATLAEAVPALDFGRARILNQSVETPDGGGFSVARFEQTAMKAGSDGLVELAFEIEGVTAGLEQLGRAGPGATPVLQLLRAQGIETLDVDFGLDVAVSLADGVIDLRGFGLAADRLAAADLGVRLTGLDFEKMRRLPEAARNGQVMQASIGNAHLKVADHGARQAFFRSMGAQDAAGEAQAAEALAAQAMQMGAAFGSPRLMRVGEAIAAFLRQGGAVEVSTGEGASISPLELMIMSQQPGGPPAVAEALKLEASYSAPE